MTNRKLKIKCEYYLFRGCFFFFCVLSYSSLTLKMQANNQFSTFMLSFYSSIIHFNSYETMDCHVILSHGFFYLLHVRLHGISLIVCRLKDVDL